MKIVCLADIHVGVKTYGKLDPDTGLNTREIQTLKVIDEIVDYTINNDIKVMIIAGDMYKNNLPSPTLTDEVNRRINRAAKAGIQILFLDGNHDVGKMKTTVSANKAFSTLEVDNVHHTRFHRQTIVRDSEDKVFKFVFLPTYHTKEEIKDIVDNTDLTYPTIFIGHLTMKGAMLNDYMVENKEIYIEADVFDKPNIAAVVLGHLHKHQILKRDPFVFYTGSAQRIDFNEEHQPKGFVVLDIDTNCNVKYEFIEVDSQKFFTAKFKFENNDNATSDIKTYLDDNKIQVKDAIVRVQIELDELTKIREKEIYAKLDELGASNVLNIQKFYNNQNNKRNTELTEHITTDKGLELYYEGKVRAKERTALGKEIIKKVDILIGG
jgi:exonuclease SbcD